MANDYIPRPDARFPARQNNFVTYVNDHLAHSGLAPGLMGAKIWVKVADPPPTRPPPGRPPQKPQN